MNPMTDRSTPLDSQLMLSALERLRGTGVEFNDFLSNHGPMAADAMIRLGGGDRVEAWVDEYRLQLTPDADPGDRVTTDNWREQLGRFDRVGDWTSHFRRAILDQGWRDVLEMWWDRLLPGAAASATHGLIRTAHAVRNLADGDGTEPLLVDELAHGLALWGARYQQLPGHPLLDGTLQIDEALARLPRLDAHARSAGPGLTGRLATLFQLEGVPDAIEDWGPTEEPVVALDELIARSARIVLARTDSQIAFCHAVTAPAAVRMIIPAIAPARHAAAVATCWQLVAAIVSAFAALPDPVPMDIEDIDVPTPMQLSLAAVEHGDDHVLKFTEACVRQFGITHDVALLIAADRFRQRIEAPR